MQDITRDEPGAPKIVDRSTFQAELDGLRIREKAHTRNSDAIAAARRRLPMVEVDGATPLVGARGAVSLLDAFEGRAMLIAYYFMWHAGRPAPEQCEGCTWVTSQVRELSYIHSRDVTFAVFCQGPYQESARYRDFMGWEMHWYSAQDSLATLLVGRRVGMMHIVCYLRHGSYVFETYWTTVRGVEAMDNSYRLLDLTVYGRQETWENSPGGWPQRFSGKQNFRIDGRPIPQWPRLHAGIRTTWEPASTRAAQRISCCDIAVVRNAAPLTPSPQPKSDISDFGQSKEQPNSDKSEFGWGEGGVRGGRHFRIAPPEPPHPALLPTQVWLARLACFGEARSRVNPTSRGEKE